MPYYKVQFKLGENNKYIYPERMARVVWKSTVYHGTDAMMVGETDEEIKGDDQEIVSLTPEQAKKLVEQITSQYPKTKKSSK